jgi:predicted ATPase
MSPQNIYKEALMETGAVLHTLETQSESVELANAIETARNSFAQLKSETDITLQELDKNAEWDALTIALYGETNAGKSTIIETLRILMGEKTKQEQQRKFRQACEKFNLGKDIIEIRTQKKQEIVQHEEDLKNVNSRFAESQAERKTLENEIVSCTERLTAQIKALPFWRHGLSFVWKIPEKE